MNSNILQDAERAVYDKTHEALDLAASTLLLAGFNSYSNAIDITDSIPSRLLSLSIGVGSVGLAGFFRVADYSLTLIHQLAADIFANDVVAVQELNSSSTTSRLQKVFGSSSIDLTQNVSPEEMYLESKTYYVSPLEDSVEHMSAYRR